MKKYLLGGLAAAGLLLGGLNAGGPASAADSDVCEGTQIPGGDSVYSVTVNADPGKLIVGYCVKAGSAQQGGGPVYVDLSPGVESVTFEYPGKFSISHYAVYQIQKPPPTTAPPTTAPPTTAPPTTAPPTTAPPTTAPPTTAGPTTTTTTTTTVAPVTSVASAGPVPPAVVPAASVSPAGAVAAPSQALPSTGSSSWGTAMIALAALMGGLGLVKLSRRSS